MKGKIVQLSKQIFGCRVVQKLIEKFSNDEIVLNEILIEIKNKMKVLTVDKNGNHVIQKFFDLIHHSKL